MQIFNNHKCVVSPPLISTPFSNPLNVPTFCILLRFQPLSQHYLPNFNECWWDSLLLDIAICNFLGETPYEHLLARFDMQI